MAEPYLGEIRLFAFQGQNPPSGWAVCDGRLLNIDQNMALYSLLGTSFGGDGKVNFALPDLRGRVPMHPQYGTPIGKSGGEEAHVLTIREIPQHSHRVSAGTDYPTNNPQGNVWGGGLVNNYSLQQNVQMSANALSPSGKGEAHPNMQPYLPLNFCIAIVGYFPPRD
ncbi:phage tail protein [Paenibacillus thermotolerans]|uniref:phage tail protein n=1 Tax=Paenibacillus thermotolerans TaxID=3027807 RepID=UPI002368B181|nr:MULTISPECIES: tail fiber protein [unclassified Paenibacillus]